MAISRLEPRADGLLGPTQVADAGSSTGLRPGLVDLVQLWRQVRAGSLRMGTFVREGNDHCAFLWVCTPAPDQRLNRALDVLESSIVHGQKVTALNHGVAVSTVAALSGLALKELGIEATVSRVPLLVALSIVASHFSLSVSVQIQTWPKHTVLRLVGADLGLKMLLSEAQYAVASGLLDGLDYKEIAKRRGVSQRTIANQVATMFRQLNVSSRAGLVGVVARALAKGPLPNSNSSTPELGDRGALQELSAQVADLRGRVQALEEELVRVRSQLKQ